MLDYLINMLQTYTGVDIMLQWGVYAKWCLLSLCLCIIVHFIGYIARLIEYLRGYDTRNVPEFFSRYNEDRDLTIIADVICILTGMIGFYILACTIIYKICCVIHAIIFGYPLSDRF